MKFPKKENAANENEDNTKGAISKRIINKSKESIKKQKNKTKKSPAQRTIDRKVGSQKYQKNIMSSIKMCVREYNEKINELPGEIKKPLLMSEDVMNPVCLNRIQFKLHFLPQFLKEIPEEGELYYIESLKPCAAHYWYNFIFEQLKLFKMIRGDNYDPLQHKEKVIDLLLKVLKNIMIFVEEEEFERVINRLSKMKKPTNEKILSVLIEERFHLQEIDILRKVDIEYFPDSRNEVFLLYFDNLDKILIHAVSQTWKLKKVDFEEELNEIKSDFALKAHGRHADHYIENLCAYCNDHIQCGFPDENSDNYGYYCPNCEEYFEKIDIKIDEISLVPKKLLFIPENPKPSKEEFTSIRVVAKKNNFEETVKRNFGQDSYTNQYWRQSTLPDVYSTENGYFSPSTQKQILYNLQNQDYLPLEIKISSIEGAGNGVFATENLKASSIVLSYVGEIVLTESINPGDSVYQIGWIEIEGKRKELSLNPTRKLNAARFINTAPKNKINCCARMGLVQGETFVIIATLKEIKKGEELYYSYGGDYDFKDVDVSHKKLERIINEKKEEKKYLEEVQKYKGKLTRKQLAVLYREFSRQKYNKYRHQFPRMRESELVSKIIKEWEAFTNLEKDALWDNYIAEKHIHEDSDNNSEYENERASPGEEPKISQTNKIYKEKPTRQMATTQLYVRVTDEEIREMFANIMINVSDEITSTEQTQKRKIMNCEKLAFFQRQYDLHFTGDMLRATNDYIERFKREFDCEISYLLLGIDEGAKMYGFSNTTFTNGFHNKLTDAYIHFMRPSEFKRRDVEVLIPQGSVVEIPGSSDRKVEESKENVVELKFETKKRFFTGAAANKKIIYIAFKRMVYQSLGLLNDHEIVKSYKQIFELQSDSCLKKEYNENFDIFFADEILEEKSIRSEKILTKKVCVLCDNRITSDRLTTHLRQEHSQEYWCQWILVHLEKNCLVFTESKPTRNLLRLKIFEATCDYKTKVKKLKEYGLSNENYIAWEIKNGNYKILEGRHNGEAIEEQKVDLDFDLTNFDIEDHMEVGHAYNKEKLIDWEKKQVLMRREELKKAKREALRKSEEERELRLIEEKKKFKELVREQLLKEKEKAMEEEKQQAMEEEKQQAMEEEKQQQNQLEEAIPFVQE